MSLTAELSIVFVLILLNGFFAMSELAIVSARRGRLKQLADHGHRGARLAIDMADDPSSFLSIVQVGMTVNSILTGAFSGATLAERFSAYLQTIPALAAHSEGLSFAVTVVGVTYLTLVVGELAPKRIGLSFAEPIAIRAAYVMHFLATVTAPMVWLLKRSTEIMLRLCRLSTPRDQSVTEEEVKDLIAEGAQSGAIKPQELAMLEGVMRMADRTVRTIMTPRPDMIWLATDDGAEVHKRIIRESGYSRFPVASGDLEKIVGIVHAKDILNAGFDGEPFVLTAVARPALIIPDSTTVLRLLEQFKQSEQHVALVADEYGSIEGLVSVTDILEAVLGALPEGGQNSTDHPVRREDGSWLIDGMTPIDEVETLLRLKAMRGDGDFHTLGGFMIERLGRLPNAGDYFVWQNARFEVMDMDGRRVDKVLIYPPVDEAMGAADD